MWVVSVYLRAWLYVCVIALASLKRLILEHTSSFLLGPTSFAPAIYQAMRTVSESGNQFHILLIVGACACVCMCACVYVNVHVGVCVYDHVHAFACVCLFECVCMCVLCMRATMYVCLHTCMGAWVNVGSRSCWAQQNDLGWILSVVKTSS